MTRPGRLGIQAENDRDVVEQALFGLCSTLDLLEEISLRMRQAMNRSVLVESVLQPGIERVERITRHIDLARSVLSDIWKERQSDAWQNHSPTDQ